MHWKRRARGECGPRSEESPVGHETTCAAGIFVRLGICVIDCNRQQLGPCR